MFEGDPRFESELRPALEALPCFRAPTDEEVDSAYAAYCSGDAERMCDDWAEVAAPTRATVPGRAKAMYERAGQAPRAVNAALYLISVRAALDAGIRFREQLSAATLRAIQNDFPWMERRHEHVPAGWTPDFLFPRPFVDFVDVDSIEDARARWQLLAVVNEVQQSAYSRYAAKLFRLPELERHAERERALAKNYLAHFHPECSKELYRQALWILDALNAAIFDLIVVQRPIAMFGQAAMSSLFRRSEWRRFVAGLDTPQWLLEPAETDGASDD